jgi:hypothetical protein
MQCMLSCNSGSNSGCYKQQVPQQYFLLQHKKLDRKMLSEIGDSATLHAFVLNPTKVCAALEE